MVFICILITCKTHVLVSNPWKQHESAVVSSIVSPSHLDVNTVTSDSEITLGPRQQECPAPPVCQCSDINNVIDCSGKGLTHVPKFKKNDGLWDLYIKDNNIHNLEDNTFQNIQIERLDISNNSLSSVSDNAFRGLESSLKSVFLQSNNLTDIPKAVTNLRNLTILSIEHNPILDFDQHMMKSITDTLYTFHFGSEVMITWPSSVQILHLFELGIYSLPLDELPETAFENLNLSWLYFNDMKLRKLPSSFGNLTELFYLSFGTDPELTSSGIQTELFEGLKGLHTLQFVNCDITTLPDIFHYTIGLFELDINSVPVRDFPSTMLPKNSNITIANFNGTSFEEVPSAISEMKQLGVLSINYNNITTLRSTDLAGLSKLEYVSISNTPLRSVSLDAFHTLTSLQYIALDNTALTTVPRAVENAKFDIISLSGNKLVCTCESMGWMKNWSRANSTGINGECSNLGNMQVWQYVRQEVPKCP